MLGTNDRWDCLNEKEFYTEYSQLLSYLKEKCTYLTVMTPLPTFPEENSTKNMENRQIADTVLQLCENNGYTCLNLYRGMIDYARNEGRALDEYFFAGCHPNASGYLALWRLIADELGLNLPVEDVYARDEVLPQVIDIGMDRPEITEQTNLADTYQGAPVFPEGVSLYAVSQPFKSDISFGGTIVTRKYSNGAGYQIFKPFYHSYSFIRRANVDGVFGPWSVTNREQYSGEDW
nr:MAG TPA: hydrolase [Caudoviricetes sp.]